MSGVVIDASVALGLVLPDEDIDARGLRRVGADRMAAPDLFAYEVANATAAAVRRGRITRAQGHQALSLIARLGVVLEPPAAPKDLLELGLRHELSAYDAAYLLLAMQRGLPLATTDRGLLSAASRDGVTTWDLRTG